MIKWKDVPEKVRSFLENELDKKQLAQLKKAMYFDYGVIIDGPHGPTGKTLLYDILRSIGYERVVEANYAATIYLDQPILELRERRNIFSELGIDLKY